MAIEELFFEGKTIDVALEKAAEAMGEDKDMLCYEVVHTAVHNIRANRAGCGQLACALAVEYNVTDCIASYKDCVENVVNTCKLAVILNKCG